MPSRARFATSRSSSCFIGGVSTLLFNGNPLLRFDGYYLLCDALELPNLASRSARHWIELLRARLLRAPVERGIVAAPGERMWLSAYAPLALLYRLAISLAHRRSGSARCRSCSAAHGAVLRLRC